MSLRPPLLARGFDGRVVAPKSKFSIVVVVETRCPWNSYFLGSFTRKFRVGDLRLAQDRIQINAYASVASSGQSAVSNGVFQDNYRSFNLRARGRLFSRFTYRVEVFTVALCCPSPTQILNGIRGQNMGVNVSRHFYLVDDSFHGFSSRFLIPHNALSTLNEGRNDPVITRSTCSFVNGIGKGTRPYLFCGPTLCFITILCAINVQVEGLKARFARSIHLFIGVPSAIFPSFL